MGAKSFVASFFSSNAIQIKTALKAVCIGGTLLALSSCLDDGPNQTGRQFLADNGILFQDSLYHVVIHQFPVDSFWAADLDPNHLGDSILIAGRSKKFSSEVRIAFDVSDTNLLDSLKDSTGLNDSTRLRLSLGFHGKDSAAGGPALFRSLKGDVKNLAFLVEEWAEPADSSITADARADSIRLWNHRFLTRPDTAAVLPPSTVKDTITLRLDSAYDIKSADSIQANPLPHLMALLRSSSEKNKWHILLSLTPIDTGAIPDSASVLRLGGNVGAVFGPALLFGTSVRDGKPVTTTNATAAQIVVPVVTAESRRGVTYLLHYNGSPIDILTGKNRGLHLHLNRQAMLDSIDAALKAQGITPPHHDITADFDLTYYVPFGTISIPINQAGAKFEGGFPLNFQLITDIDSTLPELPKLDSINYSIPLDHPTAVLFIKDPTDVNKVIDTIQVAYHTAPFNAAMRQIIVRHAIDSAKNDTAYMKPGETQEMHVTTNTSKTNNYTFTVTAHNSDVLISIFLNAHALIEPNGFRDPATGELLTTLAAKAPHLLKPESPNLKLRATNGLQHLLNRAQSSNGINPDFLFEPLSVSAVDLASFNGTVRDTESVPYPVFSIIPPKVENNHLAVDVDVYLFPLKAR